MITYFSSHPRVILWWHRSNRRGRNTQSSQRHT